MDASSNRSSAEFTRIALACGIAVPILYFGTQLTAMAFYPGYRVLTQVASELGMAQSRLPMLFNTGAMLTGIATLIASAGFVRALNAQGTHPVLSWATALAIASSGLGAIQAGYFPLPDPRHNPRILGAGTFLVPLLLAAAFWNRRDARWLRTYLVLNCVLFLAMVPIMSGVTPIPPRKYGGGLQRVAAAIFYVPIGVTAAYFTKRRRLLLTDSRAEMVNR